MPAAALLSATLGSLHTHVPLSPLGTDVSWKLPWVWRRTGQASQTIVVFPLMGSGPWKGRWASIRLYASLGYNTLHYMASAVLQEMTSRFSDNNEWVCINMTYTILSRVALANFRWLATVNQSQSARTKLWISDRQVRPPNTFWVNWVNWLTCRFFQFLSDDAIGVKIGTSDNFKVRKSAKIIVTCFCPLFSCAPRAINLFIWQNFEEFGSVMPENLLLEKKQAALEASTICPATASWPLTFWPWK